LAVFAEGPEEGEKKKEGPSSFLRDEEKGQQPPSCLKKNHEKPGQRKKER